jgi:hypothetical protein
MMNDGVIQSTVLDDVYKIFNDKEKVRKAIGYSFGSRYCLEDARVEEKIYRTFSRYMKAAYVPELNTLNNIVNEMKIEVNKNVFWVFRGLTRKALSTIQQANTLIAYNIMEAGQTGVAQEWEWKAYVDRLKYARQLGIPIVEIGEFSEEYPVQRIKELFPDYEINE